MNDYEKFITLRGVHDRLYDIHYRERVALRGEIAALYQERRIDHATRRRLIAILERFDLEAKA